MSLAKRMEVLDSCHPAQEKVVDWQAEENMSLRKKKKGDESQIYDRNTYIHTALAVA